MRPEYKNRQENFARCFRNAAKPRKLAMEV